MHNLLYNSYDLLPRCNMTSETIRLIEIMTPLKLSTKPPLSEKPAKGRLNFISNTKNSILAFITIFSLIQHEE